MITHADVLEWAREYEGPKFHALLCDPPYHLTDPRDMRRGYPARNEHGEWDNEGRLRAQGGKGFMNAAWDGGDVAYRPETWAALAAHLYPGAFGMAFASSRGWHRMAVAIEDAGLIIHPTIFCWNYSTGFPKATRIADGGPVWEGHRYGLQALKPAAEPLVVFHKPFDVNPFCAIISQITVLIEGWICTLLPARDAEILISRLHQHLRAGVECSAQKNADEWELLERVRIAGESSGSSLANATLRSFVAGPVPTSAALVHLVSTILMCPAPDLSHKGIDTFASMGDTLESIVSSWSACLDALLNQPSTFTTATAKHLITDLQILRSLIEQSIHAAFIPRSNTPGNWLNAHTVAASLQNVLTKLPLLSCTTARASATEEPVEREGAPAANSQVSPIIVFQKPYVGRPVECIAATGAGAINVDAGRIPGPATTHGGARMSPIHGGGQRVGMEDYAEHPAGRWPANLLLQHTAACGAACFTGWTGVMPCYETLRAVFVPSASQEYLLDRLPTLLQAIHEYSKACNTPLPHVAAFYRNGRTQLADSWDGLTDEVVNVLGVSGFPGFQFDCPSCCHFCDELLHRILTACQDGLPSLLDALAVAHRCLCEHAHNPRHPMSAHPTNYGAARPSDMSEHKRESRTSAADHSGFALRAELFHIEGTEQSARVPTERLEHKQGCNTDGDDSRKTPHHNACIAAAVGILGLLSADLAWRFFLSKDIISRREIDINLPACPVERLGAQSGETVSLQGTRAGSGGQHGTYSPLEGRQRDPGYGDTGTAARYFYQADWALDVAEQIAAADAVAYVPKASTAEREAGLDGWQHTTVDDGRKKPIDNPYLRGETERRNTHPTIKPLALTRYLASLLLPPDRYAPRRLLVPFAGAGSEVAGAYLAGWEQVTGVELTEEYIPIARTRIDFWLSAMARHGTRDPEALLAAIQSEQRARSEAESARRARIAAGQMAMFDQEAA